MCPANEITNLSVVITATSPPVLGLSFVSYIMRIEWNKGVGPIRCTVYLMPSLRLS